MAAPRALRRLGHLCRSLDHNRGTRRSVLRLEGTGKEEDMSASFTSAEHERYARAIRASKKVRWEIEEHVIQGRRFDRSQKFLPDGLSLAPRFTTLSEDERRFVSQIQG